jgi:hypothetical protein
MTIAEKLEMYKRKKAFVDNVSKAFEACPVGTGVVSVKYEVYKKEINEETTYFVEYIVVNFTGGGKSVRNVNGNSHTANFREIGKLVDGGYYDEIKDYEIMLERDFTKVEV